MFYKDAQSKLWGKEGAWENLFREDIQLGIMGRRASQQVPSEEWEVQKSCGSNMLGCKGPKAKKPVVLEVSEQEGKQWAGRSNR